MRWSSLTVCPFPRFAQKYPVRERTDQTGLFRAVGQDPFKPCGDALYFVVTSRQEASVDKGRPKIELDVTLRKLVEKFV